MVNAEDTEDGTGPIIRNKAFIDIYEKMKGNGWIAVVEEYKSKSRY